SRVVRSLRTGAALKRADAERLLSGPAAGQHNQSVAQARFSGEGPMSGHLGSQDPVMLPPAATRMARTADAGPGSAESQVGGSAAARGLDTLERAGVVSAGRRRGLSPIISIRENCGGIDVPERAER